MTLYLVCKLIHWDSITIESVTPFMPVPLELNTKSFPGIGYLPVFDNLEEATEHSENGKYLIQPIQTQEDTL